MKFANTVFYVEVQEGTQWKIVPHGAGEKKAYQFLDRKKSIEFLNLLRKKHVDKKFRYVKARTEYTIYEH
jgi:hypothetical protein